MKALIYNGPGEKAATEQARPVLRDMHDVIVRMTHTTICGTDLHILKGDVPTVTPGRILGHEGVGIVEEAGSGVGVFRPGDGVVISCITSCSRCAPCRRGMPSHCTQGGWILGNTIDGTQAEYVRIPWADTSLHRMPPGADAEAMVMLSDILPTGFECGVLSGHVQPGDTVVIVGAGPIGLAALLTARFFAPAAIIVIDRDPHRLALAGRLGATALIGIQQDNAVARVMELTDGAGADVVIEAVGIPETFLLCQDLVAAGGHIANVGVHGTSVPLHLEKLWARNVTITTRLVDTVSTPMLMRALTEGRLDVAHFITHRFGLSAITEAYEKFGNAARDEVIKVIISSAE